VPGPKKKAAPFQPSGEVQRVISLNKGTWAYVFDASGKRHHVKRSSIAMVEVCREVDAAMGGKIRRELEELGWKDVVARMDAADRSESNTSDD
jgi:hypothetical protein